MRKNDLQVESPKGRQVTPNKLTKKELSWYKHEEPIMDVQQVSLVTAGLTRDR